MREVRMVAELFGARLREFFHIVFAAKVQAAGGARFDARRLEAFADAVGAKRALEDAMRLRVHLRNVEWAAGKDRKSTRLNSSHGYISYAVFCLKKKKDI